MSYYVPQAGDYKTYGYGGDPGFFSKLWKSIKKVAVPVLGTIIGGPVGGILGGLATKSKTFPGGAGQFGQPTLNIAPGAGGFGRFPIPFPGPRMPVIPKPRIPIPIPIPFNGGTDMAGCCPTGYHLAKDGSGRCVRNRSLNVCNPKALRRAIRREKGFGKLASRLGYVKRSSRRRSSAKCA